MQLDEWNEFCRMVLEICSLYRPHEWAGIQVDTGNRLMTFTILRGVKPESLTKEVARVALERGADVHWARGMIEEPFSTSDDNSMRFVPDDVIDISIKFPCDEAENENR